MTNHEGSQSNFEDPESESIDLKVSGTQLSGDSAADEDSVDNMMQITETQYASASDNSDDDTDNDAMSIDMKITATQCPGDSDEEDDEDHESINLMVQSTQHPTADDDSVVPEEGKPPPRTLVNYILESN
jgi:hypothetical protein